MNKIKNVLFVLLVFFCNSVFGQAVGDFGSIASGNYTTFSTWGIWNGAVFVPAPAGAVAGVNFPNRTTNVFIVSGTTVVMTTSNSECNTLDVQAGGKIWNNTATNCYLNIHGDIICNGIIGNGVIFDGLSLGIESVVCNVTGTGTFDVSRIRKNTGLNKHTQFNIYRDINIRFNSSSQVQIYNATTSGTSRFDVYIGPGATLNLTASGALTGNAAVDGDIVSGSTTTQSAGSFTIDGTMIVTGTTYFSTNNNAVNVTGINTVAGSTNVTATSTATLVVGATVVGTGTGVGAFPLGTIVTAIINATTFTISNPANTTVNGFVLSSGGSIAWIINSGGILRTGQVSTAFRTATATTVMGSTTVTTGSTTNLTVGSGITGTGIPLGATITAIVNATTFTISSAAVLSGTNSMNFAGGNAGHLLRVMPGGTFEITGTSGFNSALPTTNSTWDVQNGSFTEFSGTGNQNVPFIPASSSLAFGNSSNFYGYLRISGSGNKNMFNSGFYNIANDLNIVNVSGTPVLQSNNQELRMLGGNWYNYNLTGFDEQSGMVRFMGSSTQTINCPGGERYFRLAFSKTASSTLQFNCPVNVINVLSWTLDGPIFLNSNRLTIESSAVTAIVNGSDPDRYIISETVNNSSIVQWNIGTVALASNYVIPFGKPGVPNYIPFTYSIPTATTVGNLAVATYGTPANNLPWPVSPYVVTNLNSTTGLLPDNRDATVDRFWEITASGGSPTATCTFTYAPAELPVAPFNNMALMVAQWFNPGTSKWIYPIAGQTTGTYTTTTPGFNTYGAWTLSAITSPLPIKLLSFSAKPNDDKVDLEWSTATEINNDYFTIERSYDGIEFSDLLTEKGAGNSTIILNYSAIDTLPLPGISYYRLKQTDFDGQFSYSNVIAVKFIADSKFFIQAGPVPATDKIRLTCMGGTDFSPELYQLDGRLVKIFSTVSEGISDLDISGISGGIYILRVNSDFGQKSLRIVKE
jgi:hypothetical protein